MSRSRITGDRIAVALLRLRQPIHEAAEAANRRRQWGGREQWWELAAYADIIAKAVSSIKRHQRRCERLYGPVKKEP